MIDFFLRSGDGELAERNYLMPVDPATGVLSHSIPLVELPGPPGFGLSLDYRSSVARDVSTWNEEAPTGLVGLGWQLALPRIIRQPMFTGTRGDDVFALTAGSSVQRLEYVGDVSRTVGRRVSTYQTVEIGFDRIQRVEEFSATGVLTRDEWTVVTTDGSTQRFGGNVRTEHDGLVADKESIGWLVSWDGWVGASTAIRIDGHRVQSQEPIEWALSSTEDLYGHRVELSYTADTLPVGAADGLPYTNALYLRSVKSSGWRAEFDYVNKEVREYPAQNFQPGGVVLDQNRVVTQCLREVRVRRDAPWDTTTVVSRVVLGYGASDLQVDEAPAFLNPKQPRMVKRLLRSVHHLTGDGQPLGPPTLFSYFGAAGDEASYEVTREEQRVFDTASGGLFGAIATITDPGGAVTHIRYDETELSTRVSPTYMWVEKPGAMSAPCSHRQQTFFGNDYVVVVNLAEPHARPWDSLAYLAFALFDCSGDEWVRVWEHDVTLNDHKENTSKYRVLTGEDFCMIAVDASILHSGSTVPPLLLARSAEDPRRWEAVATAPRGIYFPSQKFTIKGQAALGCGNGVAAVFTTGLQDNEGNSTLHLYRRVGDTWVTETRTLPVVHLKVDMTVLGSTVVVASGPVKILDGKKSTLQCFVRSTDGWHDIAPIDLETPALKFTFQFEAMQLLSERNRVGVVWWQTPPIGPLLGAVEIAMTTVDLHDLDAAARGNQPARVTVRKVFEGHEVQVNPLDMPWNSDWDVSVKMTKDSIRVTPWGVTLLGIWMTHFDGVKWSELERVGQDFPFNKYDKMSLANADNLDLVPTGRNTYELVRYDALKRRWANTGIDVHGEAADVYLASAVLQWMEFTIQVAGFVVDMPWLAYIAIDMLSQTVQSWYSSREVMVSANLGGPGRTVVIGNQHDTTVSVWRLEGDEYALTGTVPTVSVPYRYIVESDTALAFPDPHDHQSGHVVAVRNGLPRKPERIEAYDGDAEKGFDVQCTQFGNLIAFSATTGFTLLDPYPMIPVRWRFTKVVDGQATGAYRSYQAVSVRVEDGYQHTETFYSFPVHGEPEYKDATRAVYFPSAGGALFPYSTVEAGGADIGTSESYFYTPRPGSGPAFAGEHDPADALGVVAGQSYRSRQRALGGGVVNEQRRELAVYRQPGVMQTRLSSRDVRTVEIVDGVSTVTEVVWDMQTSGQAKRTTHYAGDPVDAPAEISGESVTTELQYGFETAAYKTEFEKWNLLTPAVQTTTVQRNVRSDDSHQPISDVVDLGTWSGPPVAAGIPAAADPAIAAAPRATELLIPAVWGTQVALQHLLIADDDAVLKHDLLSTDISVERTPRPVVRLLPEATSPAPLAVRGAALGITSPGYVGVVTVSTDSTGAAVADSESVKVDGPIRSDLPFALRQRPEGVLALIGAVTQRSFIYAQLRSAAGSRQHFVPKVVTLPVGAVITAAPQHTEIDLVPYVDGTTAKVAAYGNGQLMGELVLDAVPMGATAVVAAGKAARAQLAMLVSRLDAWDLMLVEFGGAKPSITTRLPLFFKPDPSTLVASGRQLAVLGIDGTVHQFSFDGAKITRIASNPVLTGKPSGAPAFLRDGSVAVGIADADGRTLRGCLVLDSNGAVRWRWDEHGTTSLPLMGDATGRVLLVDAAGGTNRPTLMRRLDAVESGFIDVKRVAASTWNLAERVADNGYVWRGSGSPDFPFGATMPPAGWQAQGGPRVVEHGVPLEVANALGQPASTVYDQTVTFPVAAFPGASVHHGEAGHIGFEVYDPSTYISVGSLITTDDSFTGRRSMRLSKGATVETGRSAAPLARALDRLALCTHVRAEDDSPASVQLTVGLRAASGTERFLRQETVHIAGQWERYALVVDLPPDAIGEFLFVRVTATQGVVLVDHLWFAPLGCPVAISVYDPAYGYVTAVVNQHGDVARSAYGSRQQLVAATDVTGLLTTLAVSAPARWNAANGRFDPLVPNAAFGVIGRRGGGLFLFRTARDLRESGWTGGEWTPLGVRLTPGVPFTYADGADERSRGIRVQLRREGAAGAAVQCGPVRVAYDPGKSAYQVSVGTQTRMVPGAWDGDWVVLTMAAEDADHTEDVDSSELRESSDSAAGGVTAYVVVGNRVLFAEHVATAAASSTVRIEATAGQLIIGPIAGLDGVVVTAQYSDGAGRQRQTQSHETSTQIILDGETVYDAVGQPAFHTKPTRKATGARHAAALGFEPDYVADRDPAGGGELWKVDPEDLQRGRLRGLVVDWAAQSYPDSADQAPYAYTGSYHEHAPTLRVVESTQSHAEYIVGTPHAARVRYGRTGDSDRLLSATPTDQPHAGVGAYTVVTQRSALSDTEFRWTVEMAEVMGGRSVHGVGYGDDPFGGKGKPEGEPDFLATVHETFYRADGTTISRSYPPNFFRPRPDDEPFGYIASAAVSPTGAALWSRSPDSGISQVVCAPTNSPVFSQDADGAAGGWFHYVRQDVLGRAVSTGLIAARFDRYALTDVAALAPGQLEDGLIGDWPLAEVSVDGITPDVSGSSLSGRVTGGPDASTISWSAPNQLGSSLDVISGSGGAGGVSLPGSAAALAGVSGPLSLGVWVRLHAVEPAVRVRTVFSAVAGGTDAVTIAVVDDQWSVDVTSGASTQVLRAPLRPTDIGSWVHLAVVTDGAHWRFFLDGIEAAPPMSAPGLPKASTRTWSLGHRMSGATAADPLRGFLSGARLYRRALSLAEVRALQVRGLERESVRSVYDVTPDGHPAVTASGAVGISTKQNWPIDPALEQGLVAQFPLDEGGATTAVSGTANDVAVRGTLVNAQFVRGGPSGLGWCVQLTSSSAITVAPNAALAVRGNITMSARFRLTGSISQATLVARATRTDRDVLQIRAGKLEVGRFTGTTSVLAAAAITVDDRWHDAVGTFDGAIWRLYLDGVEVASAADTVGAVTVADWQFGGGYAGQLSDVRIYSRALSDDEVERLHESADSQVLTANLVTESFDFDPRGQLMARSLHVPLFDDLTRTTQFAYTPLGQLETLSYPSDEVTATS